MAEENLPSTSFSETEATDIDKRTATKRLKKELMDLMSTGEIGISAFPDGDNILKWTGTIIGPPDSPYAGQTYKLYLEFSYQYPYEAPVVLFQTTCFHPNIDISLGLICVDILTDNWSALYSVRTILLSVQSLLAEANTDSPLNITAAELWGNPAEFQKKVLEYYRDSDG